MDKNAIKKYAVWAREQLIEKVTARAIRAGENTFYNCCSCHVYGNGNAG